MAAIPFLQQKQKQRYFLLAFLLILLITGVFVWQNAFRAPVEEEPMVVEAPKKEIDIKLDIFANPIFQYLKQPDEPIGPPQEFGKDNPFLPL